MLAIYLILLGWKTCKYYYETDELPDSRPTQKLGYMWHLGLFFPPQLFFGGLGLILHGKQTTIYPTHFLRKHPIIFSRVCSLGYTDSTGIGGIFGGRMVPNLPKWQVQVLSSYRTLPECLVEY